MSLKRLLGKKMKGEVSVKTIVSMAVGIIIVAAIIPVALQTFFSANTTGWPAVVLSLWSLIPVMMIVGLFILFVGYAVKKR